MCWKIQTRPLLSVNIMICQWMIKGASDNFVNQVFRTSSYWVSISCTDQGGVFWGFYTPVFRRDVLWYMYGDVRPGLHPGLRPPIFRTFLLHALTYWAEILHMTFFDVLQIKFDCRHFASIFEGVMPLCELRIKVMCSFPHFSLTCFDILSSNFAYDFVSPYYRSSSIAVNLRLCLWELCPFWNLQYWKYTVFRTFLFHALTYWAEILHMTLFHRTTDQVWVPSILRLCLWELCPFWNLEYWKYTVFRTFLLHALTYWAEILHMTFFYRTID